jgi:hypothetical protein
VSANVSRMDDKSSAQPELSKSTGPVPQTAPEPQAVEHIKPDASVEAPAFAVLFGSDHSGDIEVVVAEEAAEKNEPPK